MKNKSAIKNKEEHQRSKLKKIQQPTSEAIKEQVSIQVDEQLSDKIVESALHKSSKNPKEKGWHKSSSNLQRELILKAVLIKKLLWKEYLWIQV